MATYKSKRNRKLARKYTQIAKALYDVYAVYRLSNDWGFYCSDSVVNFIADNSKYHHGVLGFKTLEFSAIDSTYEIYNVSLGAVAYSHTAEYAHMCRIIATNNILVQKPDA